MVKLFLKNPDSSQGIVQRVLNTATKDCDSPDVRDRAYIYWRLLSMDPAAAKVSCWPSFTLFPETLIIPRRLWCWLTVRQSRSHGRRWLLPFWKSSLGKFRVSRVYITNLQKRLLDGDELAQTLCGKDQSKHSNSSVFHFVRLDVPF